MMVLWRNGDIVDDVPGHSPQDAGWGVFTTIGCDQGRPMLWSRHRARLAASMDQLGGDRGPVLPEENDLRALLAANDLAGVARLRVVVRRSDSVGWVVEAEASKCRSDADGGKPARLTIERWPAAPPLTGHKTLSRMAWDIARDRAVARGADDVMLIDDAGTVLETAIANLWIIRDAVVSTPPAPECCLPGVMRGYLLDRLPGAGIPIEVRRISEEEAADADEIWLSNAVVGVRRVGRLAERRWTNWPLFDRLADLGIPAPGWPRVGHQRQ